MLDKYAHVSVAAPVPVTQLSKEEMGMLETVNERTIENPENFDLLRHLMAFMEADALSVPTVVDVRNALAGVDHELHFKLSGSPSLSRLWSHDEADKLLMCWSYVLACNRRSPRSRRPHLQRLKFILRAATRPLSVLDAMVSALDPIEILSGDDLDEPGPGREDDEDFEDEEDENEESEDGDFDEDADFDKYAYPEMDV